LKYHPKNDSSFQAAEKFIEISQAYEMLNPTTKTEKKRITNNTFMSDFNKAMKDYMGI
jgi:DnaJ-class molecular chaperone